MPDYAEKQTNRPGKFESSTVFSRVLQARQLHEISILKIYLLLFPFFSSHCTLSLLHFFLRPFLPRFFFYFILPTIDTLTKSSRWLERKINRLGQKSIRSLIAAKVYRDCLFDNVVVFVFVLHLFVLLSFIL